MLYILIIDYYDIGKGSTLKVKTKINVNKYFNENRNDYYATTRLR